MSAPKPRTPLTAPLPPLATSLLVPGPHPAGPRAAAHSPALHVPLNGPKAKSLPDIAGEAADVR